MVNSYLFEDEIRRRQREVQIFEKMAPQVMARNLQQQVQRLSLERLAATKGPTPTLYEQRRATGQVPQVPTTGTFPWTAEGQAHQERLAQSLMEAHPEWTEEQLGRTVKELTLPLGAELAMAYPMYGAIPKGILPRMVGGEILGGLGGHGLERAGVPVAETPIGRVGPLAAGQAVGMATYPFAGPVLERAAMRGAAQIPTVARAGAAQAQRVAPGVRRLFAEELGGLKPRPARTLKQIDADIAAHRVKLENPKLLPAEKMELNFEWDRLWAERARITKADVRVVEEGNILAEEAAGDAWLAATETPRRVKPRVPAKPPTPTAGARSFPVPDEVAVRVDEVLSTLPERIREGINSRVRGLRVSRSEALVERGGGHFEQASGRVYIHPENLADDTLLHELLHAYVYDLENPAFIQAFIRARYPAEVAERLLASPSAKLGTPGYSYFGHEDVTNALTAYFTGKGTLNQGVRKAIDSFAKAAKPAAPEAVAQIPKPTARVSRPRPTGEVPPTEPPKPPKPPKGKAPPPEEPNGELLARFLEGHHDVQAAKADWAKFQGGLALRGKQIDVWMKEGSSKAKIPTGGERTPEMEQLYRALHGEGKPPMKYQSVYDEVEPFMRQQERRLLADVPEFEQRMLKDPTYFTRKWRNWEIFEDLAKEAKGEVTRGPVKPGRRVGMPGQVPKVIPRRTLPRTFSEALEVGGEPLTWNPYEMAAIHAAELEEYRFTQVLIQAWKAQKRVLPVSQAPRSWETPPYKAFQGKPHVRQPKMVEGVVEEPAKMRWSEPLAVSPEDNKMLPQILGYGFEGFENSAAYITSVFKRAKVLFGLFQYWDLQNRTLLRSASQAIKLAAKGDLAGAAAEARVIPAAAKAWQGAFYPPARNRLWKQLLADPEIAMAIEEGGLPIGGLDVWKRTMRSSLEPDLVMKAPIIGEIPTARLPMGVRQATEGTQKVMNGMYRYVASGLYDSAHPQYWSAFYKSIFKELRAKYPQMAERQVAAQAAEETNILMSSIPDWHSVLNPRLRQLGRGVAFSVNEGEAWVRMIPRTLRGKNPELYRQQWAAYLLGALTFAEVVNYAMTGEPLSVNQLSPIVMRDGKPTYNSNFARPRLDGDGPVGSKLNLEAPLGRHIYLDFMGQADTPFRMLNPQFFVMTRLSPQLSVFIQELQEKRFFGQRELNSVQEKVLFAGEQLLAPIPLVGFGQERERIGNVGAIIQATGWNVSSERLGELFARRYKEQTGREWDETTVIQRREDISAHPELQEIRAERLEAGLKYGSAFSERTAYMNDLKDQQKQAIQESLRTDPTGAKAAELIKESKAQRAQTWQVLSDSLGLDGQAPKESEVLPDFYADKYMAVEREMDVFGQSADEQWERYDAAQQQVLEEAEAAGVDVNYIKKRAQTFWDDPQLDLLETYYQQAKESMREYQAIPRFIGVPDDLAKRAEAILQAAQAMVATQGVPLTHAIAVVGKDDPQAAMIAAMESRLKNPMRSLFWKQHPELSVFWGRGAPAYLTPEAVGV